MRVAAEANSAAHHAVDELREFRREQGTRNQSLEDKIADIAKDVQANALATSGIVAQLATVRWMVGLCATLIPVAVGAAWVLGRLIH